MRCREQDRKCGYNGEQRKYYKAQSVYYHRREFPIFGDICCFVFFTQLVRDEADLLEDERELVVGADARMVRDEGLVQAAPVSVVLVLSGKRTAVSIMWKLMG